MELRRILGRLSRTSDLVDADIGLSDGERRESPLFAVEVPDEAVIAVSGATEALRTSHYPFWVMLRQRLRDEGVGPDTALLAVSYEEGLTAGPMADVREVGVVVASGARVVQYEYAYETKTWLTWEDISESWKTSPHSEAVEAALETLPAA